MQSLVSTEWLAAQLEASDLRVLDATKLMPGASGDPRADYEAGHIPGAVFMDLAEFTDQTAPVENTLPPAEKFASRMQDLGVGDGSRVVIYDDSPIASATRAWFMLTLFGANNVALLDGGLAKWKAEGRPLEKGVNTPRTRHFTRWHDPKRVRDKDQILANVKAGTETEQVVDARGAGRFAGTEPEPRPGMASGHIPGARNVPVNSLFNPDRTWKSPAELRTLFEDAGVDLNRPVVTSCGSGMTACALIFALHLLGDDNTALYDGSWSEWGADPTLPKETEGE